MSERPPQEPRAFIAWCIEAHADAAAILSGPDRERFLDRIRTGRYADPVWHREVNEVYRRVLERL